MKEPHETIYLDMFTALKSEKEKKRCCDWRKILLILTQNLYLKIDGLIHKLLKTLSEIQRILYLSDDSRTPREILRLHNSCFEHFILLKKIFNIKQLSRGMTYNKLFGKYAHNLTVHAPIQYRLINGESINAEEEERTFNTMKNINKDKTNNRPGHLIGNMIVRYECKKINKTLFEFENGETPITKEIKRIGDKLLEIQNDSLFTFDYIKKMLAIGKATLNVFQTFLSMKMSGGKKLILALNFLTVIYQKMSINFPKFIISDQPV